MNSVLLLSIKSPVKNLFIAHDYFSLLAMKPIRRFFQYLYSIYAIAAFLLLMLVVLPFILIFSLFKNNTGDACVYYTLRTWAVVWYPLIFVRHKTIHYPARYDKKQQYIYVANHASYLDIPQLLLATRRPVKILGRHDLAKVPVFGAIYRSATILVDRSSMRSRVESLNAMKEALKNGVSLFLFPEGSFNESGDILKPFQDGAFRLSIDCGIPILPIVFPDTSGRLNCKSMFSFTPGVSRSVILEAVQPEDVTSAAGLKQKVFESMKQSMAGFLTQANV